MLTHDVLVIGESLIDVLSRPQGSSEAEGGSPANIALGLGRLGACVRLHTALADDAHGQRIVAHLLESGVVVSAESWSLEQTSKAIVTVDSEGTPAYEFSIDSRMSAPLWAHEAVVHVDSISSLVAPGADEVVQFIEGLPANVLVAFDPNIRPQLLPEHSVAVARFEAICERADVVKMSDEDLDWLYPGTHVEAAMTRILQIGPRLVAVTPGREGALLSTAEASIAVSDFAWQRTSMSEARAVEVAVRSEREDSAPTRREAPRCRRRATRGHWARPAPSCLRSPSARR